MARIRTIKPEFPHSESMGRVSRDARLLFIQLWTICDDSGRTRAASRMLASLLYPYDDDAPSLIEGWLEELEREQCIRRYSVEGKAYLVVCNWLTQQKIDKPSASKLPPPPEPSRTLASPREDSRSLLGVEGRGEDRKGKDVDLRAREAGGLGEPVLHVEPSAREFEAVPLEVLAGMSESDTADLAAFLEAYPASDHTADRPTCERFEFLVGMRRVTGAALVAKAMEFARYAEAKQWSSDMVPGAQNWLREERWRQEYPLPVPKHQRKAVETIDAVNQFVAQVQA